MEDLSLEVTEVPLTERRLLSVQNFCVYAGIGRSKALDFLHANENLCVRFGRRLLVDRKKFDDWCENYNKVSVTRRYNPRTKGGH